LLQADARLFEVNYTKELAVRGNHLGLGMGSSLVGGLAALLVAGLANVASATPIYEAGNTCPTDADVPAGNDGRQYTVDVALRCVYDRDVTQITGSQEDADTYLNTADAALAGWHVLADPTDDWEGIGQENGEDQDILGFDFTGTTSGTFTISGLLATQYDQFAIGIKDGGDPRWAIFMLPIDTLTGDWAFLSDQGSLSHFALYGRDTLSGEQQCTTPPCDPPDVVTPEPASLVLLGSGIAAIASRVRRKKSR
jgi:hypothetical protein